MVFRRIEDFVAWQLATELEKRVYEITARSPAKQDADFCRDVRRSAASAPRNMAEGFGRFWPTEFAPKMRIAKGELEETQDHVRKAIRQRYVTESEGDAMITLAKRAIGASIRFVRYLELNGEDWKRHYRHRMQNEAENPEPDT
ncbi:MAG TPA: four helix bundle protein [Vicinamibacterales bacterium]|jgi:four helix bundle protein